jgi:hypothetical protein
MPSIDAWKPLLSTLAVALTLLAFYPYLRGILRGTVKPHAFSWGVWGLTTGLVFFAQLQAGGGVGAWPIGISGGITLFIAVLAWRRRADVTITRLDWTFFVLALAALPVWIATADPTWAVVLLTLVDLLGFGPTFRKAHALPHSESLGFYGLFLARNLLVVLALEQYSVATALFPAAVAAACALLMALIVWRRRTAPI